MKNIHGVIYAPNTDGIVVSYNKYFKINCWNIYTPMHSLSVSISHLGDVAVEDSRCVFLLCKKETIPQIDIIPNVDINNEPPLRTIANSIVVNS